MVMRSAIIPLLRYEEDPDIQPGMIMQPLAEYLQVVYVVLRGDGWEPLWQRDMEEHDLWMEELLPLAKDNLERLYAGKYTTRSLNFSRELPGTLPFFRADVLPAFCTPSLMLLDSMWAAVREATGATLVAVSLPAKDLLFYADAAREKSFQALCQVSARCYYGAAAEEKALSSETYVYVGGKWERFLDEEDQWYEWIEKL